MTGISSYLLNRLQTTLLTCGPFASDRELKTVFIDTRINPWRDSLPQADDNPTSRVQAIIDFLYHRHNTHAENALVLLLRVLSDRTNPHDACHRQLAGLADELERATKRAPTPESASGPSPTPAPPTSAQRKTLERTLAMARRTLDILEVQAAGYSVLTIPAHLTIQLEDQRRKVAELEARLQA